jgi:hypothetical protein
MSIMMEFTMKAEFNEWQGCLPKGQAIATYRWLHPTQVLRAVAYFIITDQLCSTLPRIN